MRDDPALCQFTNWDRRIASSLTTAKPTEWWWTSGLSYEELGVLLARNSAMPYSMAPDVLGRCTIMVPAEGAWWWLYNASDETVGNTLQSPGASLSWISGQNDHFYAVMNSPGSAYWWFYGLPLEEIGVQLEATGGTLLSLDAHWQDATNEPTFTVLTRPRDGHTSWWYYGLTEAEVSQKLAENKRIFDRAGTV
ncbi:MAG: hypothetical protein ACYDA6_03465 [Solirubrobacteraceae bacterium]